MRALSFALRRTLALCAMAAGTGLGSAHAATPITPMAATTASAQDSQATTPLAGYAIVAQDHTALRAGPRDSTPIQAVLWQGDALEVRGQRLDYLQVYDHRRERAGYVRASQVRTTRLGAEDAAELLSVLRFVRDLPGSV